MTEFNEAIGFVHSSNKARMYEKKKQERSEKICSRGCGQFQQATFHGRNAQEERRHHPGSIPQTHQREWRGHAEGDHGGQ